MPSFSDSKNAESTRSYDVLKKGVHQMISRSKATAKIVLTHQSRKSKVDGKQSLQLRIIYNRKPKYYALGYSVTNRYNNY